MRASWHALHTDLLRHLDRHTTMATYRAMQDRRPALRQFADPVALIDWLHHAKYGPERKNAVPLDLVHEAQADGADSEVAVVLLHLALWPGLDAVHGRLLRYFRGDPDLLVTELSGRFVEQVLKLDPGRVNRIAATILRNIERDVKQAMIAEHGRACSRADLAEVDAWHRSRGSRLGPPGERQGSETEALVLDKMRRAIGRDAGLVIDVAVLRFTLKEAAQRHGLTHEAARKRYRRALVSLRAVFQDFS